MVMNAIEPDSDAVEPDSETEYDSTIKAINHQQPTITVFSNGHDDRQVTV